jgi:hypothetical protein
MKRLFCALLVFVTLPAWAGSIGLDIANGGRLSFRQSKAPIWGHGSILDFGVGKALFPVLGGHFSFFTGHMLSFSSNEWLFGSGGRLSFWGCLDVNLDNDSAKHCDKKDFRGSLFTGTFKNARILKTGKNTYTLNGQLSLTVAPALAKEFDIKNVAPFFANISLKFTDTCVPSSPASCKANFLSGKLSAAAPEPTAFLLLGLGMLLAGLGHSTLSFFRAHA